MNAVFFYISISWMYVGMLVDSELKFTQKARNWNRNIARNVEWHCKPTRKRADDEGVLYLHVGIKLIVLQMCIVPLANRLQYINLQVTSEN